MTRQDESVDSAPPQPRAYTMTIRPEPGQRFVIKHFGRWYLHDDEDVFFGPYETDIAAICDKSPTNGRSLEDVPNR